MKAYLEEQKKLVEQALRKYIPAPAPPFARHLEAVNYSLFVGGKRLRPILCLAAGRAVSSLPDIQERLYPVCCALECIHTYSLIHDDLPAMDNDQLRRGRPTNHMIYGEAGAILAGDGLLTMAFSLLSDFANSPIPAEKRLKIIQLVSQAAGSLGMVGGQALDMENENQNISYETLKTIHKNKTGALITAAVLSGGIGGGADGEQLGYLQQYGDAIGLAFQIVDDLLDVVSTTEKLGKTAGSDAALGKATYPALFGLEKTREMARAAVSEAVDSLAAFDDQAGPLRMLAEYIYARTS
ncbi:MAG: farnesyl-diphosphate synthase [Deltaproteobacteria bacterium]|nr:MAG: farnesyl-diphosphate synthase [Deltaproteobacteria bacterium]